MIILIMRRQRNKTANTSFQNAYSNKNILPTLRTLIILIVISHESDVTSIIHVKKSVKYTHVRIILHVAYKSMFLCHCL